ncbi:hypothetical protein VTN77DRAFT_5842 [Rasamsonia byssochlamydoides]|uniref:uncharacterized protein n=1 Tax=Rasamsonia byssochlamydoides TaxID=89139 RepID=UPI0037433080
MDDVYATARWGNRVLRPLTSLYHRLGKYREIQSLDVSRQKSVDDLDLHTAHVRTFPRRADNRDGFSDSECGGDDPSWVPGKTDKRRIKHKYAVRGEKARGRRRIRSVLRSPEVQRTLPGAIEIATPLITGKSTDKLAQIREEEVGSAHCELAAKRRTLSHSPDRSQQQKVLEKRTRLLKQSRFFQHDSLWKASLDSSNDANYIDIVRHLDRLFLNFLEKTRIVDSHRASGRCRSLLSMVMRRLPEFIAEEQRLHDESDDEEDVDMADAYFTELEAAYGSSTKGWLPLREAVRAQGIYLVSNMIKESWVTYLTALSLIEKCIHAGEYDAVETLLSNQLLAINHYDYPDAFDPWRSVELGRDPVKILHNYWVSSRHNSYVFGELEKLLLRGAIPPEWMVTTPWKSCMASATSSLSLNDHDSAAATRLIEAVILSASGIYPNMGTSMIGTRRRSLWHVAQRDTRSAAPTGHDPQVGRVPCPIYIQDALSNLIASLITAVCGMHFVRADDDVRMGNLLKGLALVVEREIELQPPGRKDDIPVFHSLRRGYVLLGNYLLLCSSQQSGPQSSDAILTERLGSFLWSLCGQREIIKELSALVGQVVCCCERGGERERSRRARQFCARFLQFEPHGKGNLSLFLGKIAVEVAMDFAQLSQDPDDHAWAADIQETFAAAQRRSKFCGSDNSNPHPTDRAMLPFRWEESIGEWVASTPVGRTKVVQSNVPLKPMIVIPKRPPSSDQLSTNSEGSFSSEDQASSITSSVPSSSLKRTERDCDMSSPIKKRARSMYDARSQQCPQLARERGCVPGFPGNNARRKPRVPESVCSDDSSDILLTSSPKISSDGKTSDMFLAREPDSHGSSNIEVVIFNRRGPDLAPAPVIDRGGRCLPRRQAPVKPAPRLSCPSQRRHLVIPCSEDEESDDELSFL